LEELKKRRMTKKQFLSKRIYRKTKWKEKRCGEKKLDLKWLRASKGIGER
jgi:hypothetical protein